MWSVKFPKWPFDKFVYAKRNLGTQMKATGEVMCDRPTRLRMALMKAVRGAEIYARHAQHAEISRTLPDEDLVADASQTPTDERLFAIYEALQRGVRHRRDPRLSR